MMLAPSPSSLLQEFLKGHLRDSEREVEKLTACLKTAEAGNMQAIKLKGLSSHGLDQSGEVHPAGDGEQAYEGAEGPYFCNYG